MHLLKITDLDKEQIYEIYKITDKLKEQHHIKYLAGKTFILFFPETSIRTRITFEMGIKALGGECILFPPETLDKREQLLDVIKYIENWADCVIIRHSDYEKLTAISKHSNIPIINAMTSFNHPCEILTDFYSISKIRPDYLDLSYTFVGEACNISRSWLNLANVMNLKFNQVCLNGYQLQEDDCHYKFYTDLDSALEVSDVILTDSLSKNLKSEDYIANYQITFEKMKKAKKGAILNPCPPFYRNEEVSTDLIESDYFVGYEFKKNLIFVEQAIILYCLGIRVEE